MPQSLVEDTCSKGQGSLASPYRQRPQAQRRVSEEYATVTSNSVLMEILATLQRRAHVRHRSLCARRQCAAESGIQISGSERLLECGKCRLTRAVTRSHET